MNWLQQPAGCVLASRNSRTYRIITYQAEGETVFLGTLQGGGGIAGPSCPLLPQDSRTSKSIKALRPASSAQGSYREPEKLCSSPKATQHVDLRPSLTASTKGHEVLAELRLRECPETLRSRRAKRFPDPADPH